MKRRAPAAIPTLPLALAGVALAAATAGGALVRALRPAPATRVVAETITLPPMIRARGNDPLVLTPLADDPFHPTRTPPAKRYRLADAMAQSASPSTDEGGLTVLGTVVGGHDSSFAICSMNNEPPKTIRVGERIGGYRAETIERGRVIFLSPEGQKVTISANTQRRRRLPNGANPFFDPTNGGLQGIQNASGGDESVTTDADNTDQD